MSYDPDEDYPREHVVPGARVGLIDQVNQPPHYVLGGGREVIHAIEDMFGTAGHLPQSWGYVLGSRRKGREAEDLAKAQWYVRRVIKSGRRPAAGWALPERHIIDDCRAANVRGEAVNALLSISGAMAMRADDRFFAFLREADLQLSRAIHQAERDGR